MLSEPIGGGSALPADLNHLIDQDLRIELPQVRENVISFAQFIKGIGRGDGQDMHACDLCREDAGEGIFSSVPSFVRRLTRIVCVSVPTSAW